MKTKILFVCLGNICRSPAAEGVMRALTVRKGVENKFEIDSAGIGAWHVGELPDRRMRNRAAVRGYRLDSHARQFSEADFNRFDYILVMDGDNFKNIHGRATTEEHRRKVLMLADYLRKQQSPVIPDPYYGSEKDFDYALDLIEEACENLLDELLAT